MLDFNTIRKYEDEPRPFLGGLYTHNDTALLYSFVREAKPKNILDIAPREGRTTSAIVLALLANAQDDKTTIRYYLFEKDLEYVLPILRWMEIQRQKFEELGVVFVLHFDTNIIESALLDHIEPLDFLFIDANHDFILADYLVKNVASRVKSGGYIHYHDMFLQPSLEAIKFVNVNLTHPDIISSEVLKKLYPTIFGDYMSLGDPITAWEGDIVYNYITSNNYQFYTSSIHAEDALADCALYIYKC